MELHGSLYRIIFHFKTEGKASLEALTARDSDLVGGKGTSFKYTCSLSVAVSQH